MQCPTVEFHLKYLYMIVYWPVKYLMYGKDPRLKNVNFLNETGSGSLCGPALVPVLLADGTTECLECQRLARNVYRGIHLHS